MSIQATTEPSNVIVGVTGNFGHTISKNDFEVLGTKVLTYLGKRNLMNQFSLTAGLFKGPIQLTGIDAFLILEELSVLINHQYLSDSIKEQMKLIYRALKHQVYTHLVADIQVA